MTFFVMEESLPVSDEILKVSDLWVVHCRVIDFRDDTVPQGEPDSAGSRVSGSHPTFISVSPSRLDARPSESRIAGSWFHIAFPLGGALKRSYFVASTALSALGLGLCQPPSPAVRRSASTGPQ